MASVSIVYDFNPAVQEPLTEVARRKREIVCVARVILLYLPCAIGTDERRRMGLSNFEGAELKVLLASLIYEACGKTRRPCELSS